MGAARQLVRELLTDADREDLLETAALLVSEVVTNALLHAGTPIDVAATVDDEGLRVEVGDGSAHFPVRRRYGATAGTGRGMMMLEKLVDDWGVVRRGQGKTVWFHVSHADEELLGTGGSVGLRLSVEDGSEPWVPDTVEITLLEMPLLLHSAWQEHAAALLREHLLASIDHADSDLAIQVHADATDAMALLEEHVPQTEVALEPDQLMRDATDPNVSAARVVLPVPLGSVRSFRVLEDAIEEALAMSADGQFLTPPTQPEVQSFRRWLCHEVAAQSTGAPPRRWAVDELEESHPMPPVVWDSAEVAGSSRALLAADDANRILAASRPVLDLLGYGSAEQLVGRRVVAIIPERFRQAHIAGFTMYFLTSRRPLIGEKVIVPALCADGTETMVSLCVETHPAESGREVFVAELEPSG